MTPGGNFKLRQRVPVTLAVNNRQNRPPRILGHFRWSIKPVQVFIVDSIDMIFDPVSFPLRGRTLRRSLSSRDRCRNLTLVIRLICLVSYVYAGQGSLGNCYVTADEITATT